MLFLFRRAKILGAMATVEQVRDLARTMPGEYAAARDGVTTLGGLPLALDQAGAYIEETHCRIADFLEMFRQAPLRLLRERGTYVEHPASVVTTFALAFEQLERHHQAAAELLTACCFLAPEEIPEDLFTRHAALLSPALQQALIEPFAFHEIMKKLLAYALIQRHSERQTLLVHRLVQAVLRERLSEQEQQQWRIRMLRVLCAAFPVVTHEVWEECERLLPHVLTYVADLSGQDTDQDVLAAELLSKAADYLRERASYQQAELLYQQALHIWEQTLGPEHLSVALLFHRLAFLAWAQGKYKRAEYCGERAVKIRESVLGPVHPRWPHR